MMLDLEKVFNYIFDVAKCISPFIIILFGIIGYFIKDRFKNWENNLDLNKNELNSMKNKINDLENKCILTRQDLISEDKCKTCKRDMEEDVNEAIDKFDIIIAKIDSQEKKVTESVNGLLNVVLILCRGILIICKNEELECSEVKVLEEKINSKLSDSVLCGEKK